MFNATFKTLIAASVAATILTACGDSDRDAASKLLETAEANFTAGDYNQALADLDTLDARYPSQVEIRREAMHLRPKVIESVSLARLSSVDSLVAVMTLRSDSLRQVMQFVKDSFEGYYTTKDLAGKVPAERPGLYARMSPDGVFSVVSSAEKGTESTSVTIACGGESATSSEVACDGERNDRSRGVEIITFMPGECDMLGEFAQSHPGGKMTVTWNGSRNRTANLADDQAQALAEVHKAAGIFRSLRSAQIEKSRLERTIDIARSQMARTFNGEGGSETAGAAETEQAD